MQYLVKVCECIFQILIKGLIEIIKFRALELESNSSKEYILKLLFLKTINYTSQFPYYITQTYLITFITLPFL